MFIPVIVYFLFSDTISCSSTSTILPFSNLLLRKGKPPTVGCYYRNSNLSANHLLKQRFGLQLELQSELRLENLSQHLLTYQFCIAVV